MGTLLRTRLIKRLETVVSCFPSCWVEEHLPDPPVKDYQSDPIDVIQSLLTRMGSNDINWTKTGSPHDLAHVIIDHCAGNLLDRTLDKDEKYDTLHFLEWFRLSIRQLVCLSTPIITREC
jgi:hypothetical protein